MTSESRDNRVLGVSLRLLCIGVIAKCKRKDRRAKCHGPIWVQGYCAGNWASAPPESFLKRASEFWSRVPVWGVRIFGSLLLLGAAGFLYYGFLSNIKALLR